MSEEIAEDRAFGLQRFYIARFFRTVPLFYRGGFWITICRCQLCRRHYRPYPYRNLHHDVFCRTYSHSLGICDRYTRVGGWCAAADDESGRPNRLQSERDDAAQSCSLGCLWLQRVAHPIGQEIQSCYCHHMAEFHRYPVLSAVSAYF